jgi:pimeloyl-ACP methyl ester carboxylesterase
MPFTTVPLPDGRELDVCLGDKNGDRAIVFHHGTPGNSPRYQPWFAAVEARGWRAVGYSRPGYATSSPDAGRSVASAADDVADLLAYLGVGEYLSIGGSGGGPHAIACAALATDRCLGAAALVTIAPWGAEGLDYYADMDELNIIEFNAALAGEDTLREWMSGQGEEYRQMTPATMNDVLGEALPEADKALAGSEEWSGREATGIKRALEHGFEGWIEDDLAFVKPWGFDVGDIRVPVQIWQGEQDRLVPWSHGRWLADHIPGAQFTLAEGHGHFSLGVANRDQILDELIEAAS